MLARSIPDAICFYFRISLEQMNDMLEKFSSIDLSGKGHITLEEFSKYLQVPVSDSLKEVYNMYDRVSVYSLQCGKMLC